MNVKDKIIIKQSTIQDAGYGTFALRDFRKNELLDEYKGKLLTIEQYNSKKSNLAYIWEIKDEDDDVIAYIDGGNKKFSNWTRYVNCPCTTKQENVSAVQKHYKMYYYALKNIKKGDELFVWYGPEYGEQLIGRETL